MAKKRKFDRLNSIALLIIALSALLVSVWQGIENRNFNKMSMMPYLKFGYGQSEEELSISVSNVGSGVAIIKEVSVYVDEKPVSSWREAFEQISPEIEILQNIWISGELLLTPDETYVLFGVIPVDFEDKGIRIEILFESIYKEEDTASFTFSYDP